MWWALLGIVCSFGLCLACGAHNSTVGTPVPVAATHIFDLSFFTGFGISGIVYYILNRIFPVPGAADIFEEIDVSGYEEKMTRKDEDMNSTDDSTEKESTSA